MLRFHKGAIHSDIAIPVILHSAFGALVCYLDQLRDGHLGLPSSTVPSLSIVVGLMLVFRNQTSYDRFWQGNQLLTTLVTSIRNLTRSFLTCSYTGKAPPTEAERADTERTVRILLALIHAAKNHLRAEWGSTLSLLVPKEEVHRRRRESHSTSRPEYNQLLPAGTRGHEEQGLGLLLQLSIQVEGFIKRGYDRGWYNAPQSSQMNVQLNTLVAAYGNMETIHLTPLPVALLIHMKQVLALFCCVLPFALVGDLGYWTILLVGFIAFTLYGIESIGIQLEDPFGTYSNAHASNAFSRHSLTLSPISGTDKNDLKVDAIVEDLQVEVNVMLQEWKAGGQMFHRPSV